MNDQVMGYTNDLDAAGNPAGGYVSAEGLSIRWQNGPLGRGSERVLPNGAFVETVIQAAKLRLEHYQETKFRCRENELAIASLNSALQQLQSRTDSREVRAVEGTHEV